MVDGAGEPAGRLGRQIRGERRHRLVIAWIVGELDGDRLGRVLRNSAVQLLDRPLRLAPLVEPNETDSF